MKVKMITVGKVKDPHFVAQIKTYTTRLNRFAKVSWHTIKDSNPAQEGNALGVLIAKESGFTFVLSEEGRTYTSPEFATRMATIARDLVFVVGGPEGVDARVKAAADEVLSLSPMTFVHEMAQVFLVEQVYRAFTIMHHGKYHK